MKRTKKFLENNETDAFQGQLTTAVVDPAKVSPGIERENVVKNQKCFFFIPQ